MAEELGKMVAEQSNPSHRTPLSDQMPQPVNGFLFFYETMLDCSPIDFDPCRLMAFLSFR